MAIIAGHNLTLDPIQQLIILLFQYKHVLS